MRAVMEPSDAFMEESVSTETRGLESRLLSVSCKSRSSHQSSSVTLLMPEDVKKCLSRRGTKKWALG